MQTEIRPARAEEAEAILPMYEWLFEPPAQRPPEWDPARALEALREAIEAQSSVVLVADHEDVLVGLCSAYLDLNSVRFGNRCWVEDLAIHPERRSQGLGAELLAAAKQWASERGATHLELDTAEMRGRAQAFYEGQSPSWRTYSFAWDLGGSGLGPPD